MSEDHVVRGVPAPHNPQTSGDRWEKFESDFACPAKGSSTIKCSLESAKYQIDRTLFGMQEFIQNFQQAISFDRELRSFGRNSSCESRSESSSLPIPLWDTFERARVKSDIDLNMLSGQAFLGVRLVLPLGN